MRQAILFVTAALASGLGVDCVAADPTWDGFYVDGAIDARSTTMDYRSTERYSYGFWGVSMTSTLESTYDFGNTNFLG